MQSLPHPDQARRWLEQIFATRAVQRGAVIRRSIAWVDREVGKERFLTEMRRRNFHVIETADQFVVVCHNGPIRLLF